MDSDKITIHDIAKLLNIDSSTVSRALNNSPRVTEKTKNRIIAKANELGYQRNHLASNLRLNKTNTLGVIVPRISRHFFSSAIAGIEETAYKLGFNVIICQSLELLEREQSNINTLLANRVDGVLVSISMETENYDHFEGLKQRKIPFVFFDRHCNIPETSSVLIDDFKAGFDATEHLIIKGCQSIAHFSGPLHLEIYKNRFEGYKAALSKHNLDFNDALLFSSRLMEQDGIDNVNKMLALSFRVDGIFSANDVAAISAMQQLKREGITVPKDIAVVGFSNETISAIIEPSLTTINQPGFDIGRSATELLVSQIKNGTKHTTNEHIIIHANLIERNSSQKGKQPKD
ncbi:LacI family DNA-binding transcriptional regulator [Gelidibacter salicanalis]|uniref:LacI family DNA-binding transcriptional regulator n=1 Tax=Gelidibacter salicanalis TaxID=291193 RepID=A0A934KYM3_9FLAO|nr:LacI family DNA-binding transcriptional regulator [Gelidibacter salicanalis]MBJ7883002.1 LacI family DNA-binding transcriptional regulator [Gelidibacter salicanalis]